MSTNEMAYKQATNEHEDAKLAQVKNFILDRLNKIEERKKDKEKLEEEMRILKLDIEDARNGKFDNIQERIEKSRVASNIGVPDNWLVYTQPNTTTSYWWNGTQGTYTTSSAKIYYF